MQKGYTFALKKNSVDRFKYKCSQVFLILCVMIFAVVIYVNTSYSIAPVSGYSMYPTLNNYDEAYYNDGHFDRVVLNYIKSYKKGDIIVAKKYFGSTEDYMYVIKRLIATENDTVEILTDGNIKVNDKEISEDYVKSALKEDIYTNFMNYKNEHPEYFNGNIMTIPKGHVFYLGDNRGNSYDCSHYGPVKESMIIAKVEFVIKDGESLFQSIFKQIFNK